MTLVNIIGSGHMAGALARRMIAAREPVTIVARDGRQARDLVESLGPAATGSFTGEPIDGHIVFLAVPYTSIRTVITDYGSGLDGKIVVDISNPVDYGTFDALTVPAGSSSGEETSALLKGRADVVKAFNTTFAGPLATGTVAGVPLDVFLAGDSEEAKAQISRLVAAAGLRPIDVGPLRRSRELEAFMLLVMGLQVSPQHERFNWDTALKILP
jgi:8-hydroxy-5-deazaflavin:NADPH oxidoreductase